MGVRQIRHSLTTFCWRLLMGTAEKVPKRKELFGVNGSPACDGEKRNCSGARGEVGSWVATPTGNVQVKRNTTHKAGVHANQETWAADIATQILESTSGATISNVLVLGTHGSSPLKRTEIRFDHPEKIPPMLASLAAALERSGVEFRTSHNPDMPATEIWLTSPLEDRKKMLVSCGLKADEQGDTAVEAHSSRGGQSNSQSHLLRRWL